MKFRTNSLLQFGLVLMSVGIVSMIHADTEEEAVARGLEIAQTAQERKEGFGNYLAKQVMVLRDRKGFSKVKRVATAYCSCLTNRVMYAVPLY